MGQSQVGKISQAEYPRGVSFLIYINDLPGAVAGFMKLFADDVKL